MTNPGGPNEQWGQHPGEAVPLEKMDNPSGPLGYPVPPPVGQAQAYSPSGYPIQPPPPEGPFAPPPPYQPQPTQPQPHLLPGGYAAAPYPPPQQPGYGYAPNPYGYPGYPPPSGASGLAIAALICSCAGVVFCGIPSIVGIILGVMANSQAKQRGQYNGEGLAKAAIWTGVAVVALNIAMLVFVIVVGLAESS